MKKKYVVIIALACLLVVYLLYRAFFVHEKVKTVEIKRGNLVTIVYATGVVSADSVATLRSESGGIVRFLLGKEGTQVKKGSVLLRTDTEDEALKLKDVENQLQQSKLDLENKTRDLARKENLIRTNAITRKEFEDAQHQADLAKIILEQKKVALEIARRNITKTEITAPFSGLLVNVKVNLGDYITPNSECFEILAPNSMLVEGEVDEQDLGKISKGMPSLVAFDAYADEKFEGKVERIVPRTDEATKTSKVYIRLSKTPGNLNIGMTATINIKAGQKNNILLLQRTAILQESSKSYVFAVENERLRKIQVSSGLSDGKFAEITDNKLPEGTKVVDQPLRTLKDNMKVEIN